MYVDKLEDDFGVVEDEFPDVELCNRKIVEIGHPSMGFPKALNRNRKQVKDLNGPNDSQ